MCKTIRKLSKFVRPPTSPNTVNQSEYKTTKMLPPSGQLQSESECRNLGHDPGKQDGGSATQCFEAFLVMTYFYRVGAMAPLAHPPGSATESYRIAIDRQ